MVVHPVVDDLIYLGIEREMMGDVTEVFEDRCWYGNRGLLIDDDGREVARDVCVDER